MCREVNDLSPLSRLSDLTCLQLPETGVSDLQPLGNVTGLLNEGIYFSVLVLL
jgi:hypothetical protein